MSVDVRARIERLAHQLADRFPHDSARALEMCGHGEWGIAIEDLLGNLHEQHAVLRDRELEEAEAILREVHSSVMLAEALRGLHRDEDGRQRAVVFTVEYLSDGEALRELVATALGLSPPRALDWHALREAIGSAAAMPRVVKIWGWEKQLERSSTDGRRLLSLLRDAGRCDVALYTSRDEPVDTPTAT